MKKSVLYFLVVISSISIVLNSCDFGPAIVSEGAAGSEIVLTIDVAHSGTVAEGGDSFYSIVVTGGVTYTITASSMSNGTANIYIYSDNTYTLASYIDLAAGDQLYKNIIYTPTTDGTLYIKIASGVLSADEGTTYTLTVT